MNMLRLKFSASFACSAANGESSRLIIHTARAPTAPAMPAAQLVTSARISAARWAPAAHWRSCRVGTPLPGTTLSAGSGRACSGMAFIAPLRRQLGREKQTGLPPMMGAGRRRASKPMAYATGGVGLLDQAQRERIAVGHAFVRLDPGEDAEDQVADPDHRIQQETDGDGAQHDRDHPGDDDS